MKALAVVGVIALAVVAYSLIFLVPHRKDCVAQAQARYSQATTNYQEGLIDADTYQRASDMLKAEIAACHR